MPRDVTGPPRLGWRTEIEPPYRTGLVRQIWMISTGTVMQLQFGADGPVEIFLSSEVRPATKDEIDEKLGR